MVEAFKQRFMSGQGLSEYVLIGALCLVVAIGAMLTLGGNLKGVFSGMLSQPAPEKSQVAHVTGAGGLKTGPSPSTGSANPSPPTKLSGNKTCIDGNICVDQTLLDAVSQNPTQTTGGNGSEMTRLNSDFLLSTAQQLALNPDVPQSVIDQLTKLANMGHDLAAIEANGMAINAQYCNQVKPGEACPLADRNKILSAFQEIADAKSAYQNQRDAFQRAMYEHWKVMKGPTADLIKKAAQNTIDYGNDSRQYTFAKYMLSLKRTNDDQMYLDRMKEKEDRAHTASDVTHRDSNTICRHGGRPPDCISDNHD